MAIISPFQAWRYAPELVQIDQAGFIEPFTLLNRANNDIAQDYATYRAAQRDKIYRYLDEFVVPKTPSQ